MQYAREMEALVKGRLKFKLLWKARWYTGVAGGEQVAGTLLKLRLEAAPTRLALVAV